MEPRFSEMNKVRVICECFGNFEGYVLASQFRDGKWIYKISISEDPASADPSFDNVRIKNLMASGIEGGVTKFQPSGERMSIYDAALKYQRTRYSAGRHRWTGIRRGQFA